MRGQQYENGEGFAIRGHFEKSRHQAQSDSSKVSPNGANGDVYK